MSRRCMITGKSVMTGNNVSHANNRTRRRFLSNIQDTSVYSEVLKRWVSIKTSNAGLRTVEHKGGFDAFLMNTAKTKLDPALRALKAEVEKASGPKVKKAPAKRAPKKAVRKPGAKTTKAADKPAAKKAAPKKKA